MVTNITTSFTRMFNGDIEPIIIKPTPKKEEEAVNLAKQFKDFREWFMTNQSKSMLGLPVDKEYIEAVKLLNKEEK